MTFRMIAILSAVCVAAFALADALFFGTLSESARAIYNAFARTGLLALVAVAAGVAANRFGWWREYVGRAWTLFFVAYALLTTGEVLRRFFVADESLASEICIVAANLAIIAAYVLTARSFKAAGLDFGTSRTRTVVATLVSLAIALPICQDAILSSWRAMQNGSFAPSNFVSPLADVVTFVLVAPILLSAFALRGGQQFWMFALLTTGTIGWMINQGADNILSLFGEVSTSALRSGRMTGFAMACIFIAAAAFTQWYAAHRTTREVANV